MGQMFEVVTGPLEGTSLPILGTLSIGRSSQNDITLPYDPWISSSHATLKSKGDVVYVMDLHSSNGSYVQSKKIPPNTFVPLREYLIIGSTLCRICDGANTNSRKPLSVKKGAAKTLLTNSLAREALRIARDRRSPTLSVLHLFMAALRLENNELTRFLNSLKLDPNRLFSRLEKLQLFSGSREWINDFLIYQYKTKEISDCYITPLVQDCYERFGGEPFEPITFIKMILRDTFNILHPMLGISGRENEESMPGITEKVTLNPYDSDDSQIILPRSFWTNFRETLEKMRPIILCGSPGSGKTAILKQCFHALPKVDVPQFHKSGKTIYDPEVFLVFSEICDLTPFINRIIKQLRGEELIAIDHFGFLLQLMERAHVESSPLISAIRRRKAPTIIGIRTDHRDEISAFFPRAETIDLDSYLQKVTFDILKNLLLEFEAEVRSPISEDASHYLEEELLKHYNLASIKAYFHFCAEKIRGLGFLYKSTGYHQDKKEKFLSKAFFQTAFDHWASPFRPNGDHRHPAITAPNTSPLDTTNGDEQVLLEEFTQRIETVLRRFWKNHLRSDLVYSDGSRTLAENPDQARAREELAEFLDTLLGSIGTSFNSWLNHFLSEIDPSRSEAPDDETRWQDFISWFEGLDRGFARDHFMDVTRKTLKRTLRQKTLH